MPRATAFLLCVLALGGLGGCDDPYPLAADLTESDRAAAYPALLPVETIRAEVPPPRSTAKMRSDLESRAERLRARAARLRQGSG